MQCVGDQTRKNVVDAWHNWLKAKTTSDINLAILEMDMHVKESSNVLQLFLVALQIFRALYY